MNRAARRHPDFKKAFAAEQAKHPRTLTQVPQKLWPQIPSGKQTAIEVWRSCHFLVVIYREHDSGFLRMTVNRCQLKGGGWADEITWNVLQEIKRDVGRGEQWAVECFPPDSEVVNVANMRHLWLIDPPPYGWHRSTTPGDTPC